MTIIRRLPGRQRPGFVQRAAGILGVLSICMGTILALGVTASSAAPAAAVINGFEPEGANTYTTESGLSPQCPNALAGTPGSNPSSKVLNTALNTPGSFGPNGTVHYKYIDNPLDASQNFDVQDCIVIYPTAYFSAADVDPLTGVVTNTSKTQLGASGTQVDGATLSGVLDSTGLIYFSWTSPTPLTPGNWVCNFARDISTGHGGGGNRKVSPVCYQVQASVTPAIPTRTSTETCNVVDTYTIPTTTGVTYKVNTLTKAAGTYPLAHSAIVNILAVANAGYYFPTGTVTTWSFTGGLVETCAENPPVTPAAATHTTNTDCGVADTYTIPDTTGVLYQVLGVTKAAGDYPLPAGTSVTITAIADTGYTIVALARTSWGPFLGSEVQACPIPASPANPIHTVNTSCGVVDTYTILSTTGVIYQVGGVTKAAGTYDLPAGTSVTITAIPVAGYVFGQGDPTRWGPFTGSAIETCGGGTPTVIPTTTTVAPTTTTVPPTTTTVAPTTTTAAPQVLALTPEVEPVVINAPAPPPPPPAAPQLPFTGSQTARQALFAIALLAFGSLLLVSSRQRKQTA